MRISFDLDDTLVPSLKRFPLEPKPLLSKIFRHESIRLGTKELLHKLQRQGDQILIYTTSYRSKFYIKFLFRLYGIKIVQVINQKHNLATQSMQTVQFSKNPGLFGINLHVDDLKGVKLEAELNNSQVIVIEDSDLLNVNALMQKISYFRNKKRQQ